MANIREYTNKAVLNPNNAAADTYARAVDRAGDTRLQGARMVERQGAEAERLARAEGGVLAAEDRADAESRAGIMEGVGAAGKVATIAYDKFVVLPELSKGARAATGLTDQLASEWKDLMQKTDPNDNSIVEKFREQSLEPALERFVGSFNTEQGREWARGYADRLRERMFTTTAADASTRAGIATAGNIKFSIETAMRSVRDKPDLAGLYMDELKVQIENIIRASPGLDAEKTAKINDLVRDGKNQIAISAIQGVADVNPAKAIEMANSPEYAALLDNKDRMVLIGYAHTQRNIARGDEDRARQNEERLAKKVSDKTEVELLKDMYGDKPTITAKKVIELGSGEKPLLTREATERMLTTLRLDSERKRIEGERITTDPATYDALTKEMLTTDNPVALQRKILQARVDKKLDEASFNMLRLNTDALYERPLKEPMFKEAMQAAEDVIKAKLIGVPGFDPKGSVLHSNFVNDFLPKYLKALQDGTLPPNALDANDPKSFISQSMAPYKRTQAQKYADFTAVMGMGGAGGVKPGEVPAEFTANKIPKPLQGIKGLLQSPPTGAAEKYRDPATGKVYDKNGVEAK